MSRIGPLPGGVVPVPEPDSALAGRIERAVEALRRGGTALAEASELPPGAKRDFSGWRGGEVLEHSGTLRYIGEEDAAGRGIHRHGSEVARVRYYGMTTTAGRRFLFVHLTAEGLVTDIDVVSR